MSRNYITGWQCQNLINQRHNGLWILIINIAVKFFSNKKIYGHLEVIIELCLKSHSTWSPTAHPLFNAVTTCQLQCVFIMHTLSLSPAPKTYMEFFKGVPLPWAQIFYRSWRPCIVKFLLPSTSHPFTLSLAFYATLIMLPFLGNVKLPATLRLGYMLLSLFQNIAPPQFLPRFYTQTSCIMKVSLPFFFFSSFKPQVKDWVGERNGWFLVLQDALAWPLLTQFSILNWLLPHPSIPCQ